MGLQAPAKGYEKGQGAGYNTGGHPMYSTAAKQQPSGEVTRDVSRASNEIEKKHYEKPLLVSTVNRARQPSKRAPRVSFGG